MLLKITPLFLFATLSLNAQIVLSEIMFDLEGSDSPNEFVEIYNLSSQDTINLAEWKIRDKFSLDDLVDAGLGLSLSPYSFAVILEGDYDILTGIYSSLIPDSTLLLKVDDNSIGNGLSSSDSLFLINYLGDIVDSYGWNDIEAPGFSLERIRLDQPSNDDNWATSIDSLGTPGFKNSVSLNNFDAAIQASSISHSPQFPTEIDKIELNVWIYNLGLNPLSGEVIATEEGEMLGTSLFSNLIYSDSIEVILQLISLTPGFHLLNIEVSVENDENSENNQAQHSIYIRFTEKTLTINEFLYNPEQGIPEFIELVNISGSSIDILDWGLSDQHTNSIRKFPQISIPPDSYFVISKDSSLITFLPIKGILIVPYLGFPSLNNTSDAIYLFDPSGFVIDSLEYSSSWGGMENRSLEKFHPELSSADPSNWGTCVSPEKMTPGSQNSIYLTTLPTSGKIQLNPNPFSPDGDGMDDELRITYNLPFPQAAISVSIFDIQGRLVRTLADNLATGSQGVLSWNGRRNNNRQARIGLYILKIIATDSESNHTIEWVKTVVLAKPLR